MDLDFKTNGKVGFAVFCLLLVVFGLIGLALIAPMLKPETTAVMQYQPAQPAQPSAQVIEEYVTPIANLNLGYTQGLTDGYLISYTQSPDGSLHVLYGPDANSLVDQMVLVGQAVYVHNGTIKVKVYDTYIEILSK
jgi:hypothetical protein